MLTNFRLAVGTVVIARNGVVKNAPVGKVIDTVIDSNTGSIEALWVATGEGMRLLIVSDILSWKQIELVISEENDLVVPEDLPKLQKILSQEVAIINAPVYGEFTNKKLGRVYNFTFDTISPAILSLQIKHGWWMFSATRVIPRSKVIRITEKAIYVNDQGLKISEKDKSVEGDAPVAGPQ